ncbi:MAG TPA: ABC transporter permease [Acidimicrobiia bacterium]|nr:ABC transporter permease [Acidimicrobiia bacterium]
MRGFVARRLLVAIPVVLVATFVVFLLVSATGDPLADIRTQPATDPQTVRLLEEQYHLNDPVVERYVHWLGDFVQGDWGTSFSTDRPVTDMIGEAAWNSFLLVGTTVVLSVFVALLVGIVSAVRQRSAFDYAATGFSYFGFSMPDFFFALLLQLVLVVWLREQFDVQLFYVQGKYTVGEEGNLVNLVQHMVLPVATLMLTTVAAWSRYQRDSMLDVLRSDYIRTARAKGVPRSRIVRHHALRNALIPFVTVVAIDTGVLLGGVVVVERIFSWPGLGLVFFTALERSDYPVVLAWTALATVFVVLCNLVADVIYGLLDPRIRVSRRSAGPSAVAPTPAASPPEVAAS